ncbi:tuftelin-like isoform X2 [Salmo trutta]|uniref:tuftelin-like isoform X2 n=1 Tax=Salmo trutta TaxID=8032 RepID=UPI00113034B2|nr:tuftelin-like isoform X2 [Salmo trutta]
MLKSQQRKVFHMIKQLQTSRTVIQERDQVIRDAEEKNTEMRDQIEYFLEGQKPSSLPTKEWKPKPHCLQVTTPSSCLLTL